MCGSSVARRRVKWLSIRSRRGSPAGDPVRPSSAEPRSAHLSLSRRAAFGPVPPDPLRRRSPTPGPSEGPSPMWSAANCSPELTRLCKAPHGRVNSRGCVVDTCPGRRRREGRSATPAARRLTVDGPAPSWSVCHRNRCPLRSGIRAHFVLEYAIIPRSSSSVAKPWSTTASPSTCGAANASTGSGGRMESSSRSASRPLTATLGSGRDSSRYPAPPQPSDRPLSDSSDPGQSLPPPAPPNHEYVTGAGFTRAFVLVSCQK